MMWSNDNAGRVGPGGVAPKHAVSIDDPHQPRPAARTVSRPLDRVGHRIEIKGSRYGSGGESSVAVKQRVLKLIVGKSPPDPTRPALASEYASQPILNAPN